MFSLNAGKKKSVRVIPLDERHEIDLSGKGIVEQDG
jgi:hypothetical protein